MVYVRILKPAIDRIVAGIALLALLPMLATLAFIVRGRVGKPVLFWQQRIGHRGKPFKLVKFRTMTNQRNSRGDLLPDAARLTAFGRWLRSSSLDELPELWNIVRGEMSFVGPRPLLPEYLPLYSNEQSRRHEAKPGLTGLAQTSGRNQLSWETKFELDVKYVDTISPWLDAVILLKTIACVFSRSGISAANSATMVPFRGNKPPAEAGDRAA